MDSAVEYWLSGPLPAIPVLLQPVAHALLQSRREISHLLQSFPQEALWLKPLGLASTGFHLLHLRGVLDRMFSYASHRALNPAQLDALAAETLNGMQTTADLVAAFSRQVDVSLQLLQDTNPAALTEPRFVGRQQIPTTLHGLLVHAAEHTMRHTGQLLVTARVAAAMVSDE